jgi:hypothetical protein
MLSVIITSFVFYIQDIPFLHDLFSPNGSRYVMSVNPTSNTNPTSSTGATSSADATSSTSNIGTNYAGTNPIPIDPALINPINTIATNLTSSTNTTSGVIPTSSTGATSSANPAENNPTDNPRPAKKTKRTDFTKRDGYEHSVDEEFEESDRGYFMSKDQVYTMLDDFKTFRGITTVEQPTVFDYFNETEFTYYQSRQLRAEVFQNDKLLRLYGRGNKADWTKMSIHPRSNIVQYLRATRNDE